MTSHFTELELFNGNEGPQTGLVQHDSSNGLCRFLVHPLFAGHRQKNGALQGQIVHGI